MQLGTKYWNEIENNDQNNFKSLNKISSKDEGI